MLIIGLMCFIVDKLELKKMKKYSTDYSLYLVTDRNLMSTPDLSTAVEQAVLGGCTMVQLREKDISSLEFYRLAKDIKSITDRYDIPLIINDRIDIALSVNAAGVHIGQDDIPAVVARQMIGTEKILGVSASTVKEAKQAQADGADYLGIGAMFPTGTKTDAYSVSIAELAEIRNAVTLPIVVIGGISKDNIPLFYGMGVDGIAVVSALIAAPVITVTAQELKSLFLIGAKQ